MFSQSENPTISKPITKKLTSLQRSITIRQNLFLLEEKFENFNPETGMVQDVSHKWKKPPTRNSHSQYQ